MTKHILDRPHTATQSWLGRAITIEKGAQPDTASLTLQRRKRGIPSKQRLVNFLRIEQANNRFC